MDIRDSAKGFTEGLCQSAYSGCTSFAVKKWFGAFSLSSVGLQHGIDWGLGSVLEAAGLASEGAQFGM